MRFAFIFRNFLRKKTRLLDIWFCLVPVFMGYQLYNDNPVNAFSMLAIAFVLLSMRPMVSLSGERRVGSLISQDELDRLNAGENVTLHIFDITLTLTREKQRESFNGK